MPHKPSDSTAEVVASAALSLRAYLASNRTRTDLIKAVAEDVFALRREHRLADGRSDWGGRSAAYRRAIHDVYSEAGVPADVLDTVQAAIRYHLGNLLRDRVAAEDLAAVGLGALSPRQRLDRTRDVVAALSDSGGVGEAVSDPLRLVAHAVALLERIDAALLDTLTGARRRAVRKGAADVASHAARIDAALAPRSAANGRR